MARKGEANQHDATIITKGAGSRELRPSRRKPRTAPRARSLSRRKQQTLTQMDFVSIQPADLGDYDLEYLQKDRLYDVPVKTETSSAPKRRQVEQETQELEVVRVAEEDSTYRDAESARPSKQRRKNRQLTEVHEVYSSVRTRSSMKQDLGRGEVLHEPASTFFSPAPSATKRTRFASGFDSPNVPNLHLDRRMDRSPDGSSMTHLQPNTIETGNAQSSDALRMPPPCTPQKQKREEVPSSQSPPATPWSTTSRNSHKSITRSPLQQKSVNAPRSSCFSSRRTIQPRPRLEIQDTSEDDKENHRVFSLVGTPTRCLRRVSGRSTMPPLYQTKSMSSTNGEFMEDLARVISAAPSSTAKRKCHLERGGEIGDSDGREESTAKLDSNHVPGIHGEEAHIPILSAWDAIESWSPSNVATPSPNHQKYSNSSVNTELFSPTPPIQKRAAVSLGSRPRTPAQKPHDSESDEVAVQIQQDLFSHAQPALSTLTPSQGLETLVEPLSSSALAQINRERIALSSPSPTDTMLDPDPSSDANLKGVDLGVLVGWRRPTDSERLADSLLRDSLDVEDGWSLDMEEATNRSLFSDVA